MQRFGKYPIWEILFLAVCVIGTGVAVVVFFAQLPLENTSLGIDLIFDRLRGGDIRYEVVNGLRNPPWSAVFFMPLGDLPRQVGWGIWAYITLVILVMVIPTTPKKWLYVLSVMLMLTAFPTLRVLADGQLDAQVIGGVVLIVYAMRTKNPVALAFGALFATAKPQAVFLLMPYVAWLVLRGWDVRRWLVALAIVALFVVPLGIWKGADWIAALGGTYQAGGIIDISLAAALNRLEFVPSPIIFALWLILLLATIAIACTDGILAVQTPTLTREKAAFLITASLLLAPYSAGNSVIIVLAVGAVMLLHTRFWAGLGLFVMADGFYPFNHADFISIYSYYWTVFLIVSWLVFAWHIHRPPPVIIPPADGV
jgi:hypothetical protein